jgi:hypothetical protein
MKKALIPLHFAALFQTGQPPGAMIRHTAFSLPSRRYGFHLITDQALSRIGEWPDTGLPHPFLRHTPGGLARTFHTAQPEETQIII